MASESEGCKLQAAGRTVRGMVPGLGVEMSAVSLPKSTVGQCPSGCWGHLLSSWLRLGFQSQPRSVSCRGRLGVSDAHPRCFPVGDIAGLLPS